MQIAVCVKQVPSAHMGPVMNPADVFALEEALRIRERQGGSVTAVSMGAESAAQILRSCISLGADAGVLLTDRLFAGGDTLATATVLSRGLELTGKPDLILCGTHSTDGETAQVGPALAEKLGTAHITHVLEILALEEQHITCRRMTETGFEIVQLMLPALITVHKGINQPRMATINGILKANRCEITRLSAQDLSLDKQACGLAGSPTRVQATRNAADRQVPFTVSGKSLREQIEEIAQLLTAKNMSPGI
ncbi:electron transfer flavoprotein subunit beta/FixA family protein [Paenibacillus sp. FSL R7-0297]|uniref:electron transfer flavoprotein subunit beta/FixA family protein n=1 Tax=unclassified Paenibacillus TaxID=185978 RepID=UPI0005A8A626|nr:electron transfer flavoprotein subunit beta/FixA family protein [Paenibacillus sp. FSL R5-0912]